MEFDTTFSSYDTPEAEDALFLEYISLNHECISQPFLAHVKSTLGWTAHQFSAICYLKRYKMLSMSELSDMMMITRQQTTQLVGGLVNRGLAEREYDPSDRRVVYVRPTELAVDGLVSTETTFSRSFSALLADVPKAQRGMILNAMHVITKLLLSTEEHRHGVLAPFTYHSAAKPEEDQPS